MTYKHLDEDIEQMFSDLQESQAHCKMLERELDDVERECEGFVNELAYWNKFEKWLEQVYPNAITEFNAICDIERSV
jgi:ABC-type transporter MlaC component